MLVTALFALFVVSFGRPENYVQEYRKALAEVDWSALKTDILQFLTTSQPFWPPDYGNYGPFMVRQAWHCSGSYRTSDGHGGCDGGRQRFDPERSWEDNTNLDKAKTLLMPLKIKYGLGLSWGDLIIFTANVAIESMGGPVFGFCAGRIDDFDGIASELLGPTRDQVDHEPCAVNGECGEPFGTTTIGLIYINPEGPMGVPLPAKSAPQVRDVFSRMSMDDLETVALIGGGHAFGKTHGACPLGPGPDPKKDPRNPWPGECGSGPTKGIGPNTYTSGFEGPWSTTPTQWGNRYFTELLNNQWEVVVGPGGHHQWKTTNGPQEIMMLTTDISLLHDPLGQYQQYVKMFATNITNLDEAFSQAWYKLTTRDMGPVTRCVGPFVPPPQPFQNPLPPPPAMLPKWDEVRAMIRQVMTTDASGILRPDHTPDGKAYYGAVFVHLAWQSASTFRASDYIGGANGARIRFPPQTTWPHNVAMNAALQILSPIQKHFQNLSFADLIVLAGNVALEQQLEDLSFCGARTDASDGTGSNFLPPNGNYSASFFDNQLEMLRLNLTAAEFVALSAKPRSPAQMGRQGYFGSWTTDPSVSSNQYFITLLTEIWKPYIVPGTGKSQWKAQGKELFMVTSDLNIKWETTFLAYAQEFAANNNYFLDTFARAWTKVMNIDRFDGPGGNYCDNLNK